MSDLIEVVTTVAHHEEARSLAGKLIERRLAACVQIIGPITSVYRWQGNVEQSQEWMCRIKTPRELFDRLAAAIRELHSYETPEIIALPVVAADADYVSWAVNETSQTRDAP